MPDTLTKADIIEAIQKENGYSRNQSSEITETLMEIIKQSLESGEDLTLPPRRVVTFKCSETLRDRINNG